MTTTINAGEEITMPQELLDEAGVKPGTPVEITIRKGHIEIDAATDGMRLERRGRLMVLVPEEPIEEPMTDEQLIKLIDEFRNGKWD